MPEPYDLYLSISLSELEVSEDLTHYTRGPNKPLQFKRLLWIVKAPGRCA